MAIYFTVKQKIVCVCLSFYVHTCVTIIYLDSDSCDDISILLRHIVSYCNYFLNKTMLQRELYSSAKFETDIVGTLIHLRFTAEVNSYYYQFNHQIYDGIFIIAVE